MPRILVEAAANIRDRFTSVSVKTYPFPHFVLPSVLPEQIYKEMEGSLPPPWRWKAAVNRRSPQATWPYRLGQSHHQNAICERAAAFQLSS